MYAETAYYESPAGIRVRCRAMRFRGAGTGLVLALLAGTLAACGGGSSAPPKPAKEFTIEIENFGPSVQVSIPRTVDAGVQELVFRNQATGEHSAQIVRFDGKHSPAQTIAAANAWGERGKPLPGWIHLAGGFGPLKSRQNTRGSANLAPGRYLVIDLEAKGKPVYSIFNAAGKLDHNPLPATGASIEAADYSFKATGLKQGAGRVRFENTGKEPHMVAAAPLAKGATLADVKRFVRTEKGKPPVDEADAIDLAVIDGGGSQTVDLDLKRGKYALLCFVPDRKGGPPHVAKGMIGQAEVR